MLRQVTKFDSSAKPFTRGSCAIASMLVAWLAMMLWNTPAHAFNVLTLSDVEYDALPRYCNGTHPKFHLGYVLDRHNLGPRPNRPAPRLTDSEAKLRNKIGTWHYCHGLVKVRRAEFMMKTPQRDELMRQAIGDVLWSYNRIDRKHPWAADMGVTAARAYRLADKLEDARSVLDEVIGNHPAYAPAYVASAQLAFDAKDYAAAVDVLEAGLQATGGDSGEIQYFLGLAYFHQGNIAEAKAKAEAAAALGYPLRGLHRKLREHAIAEGGS